MKANKFRISNESTGKLRFIQGKTGLTPNILLRIGFCLSLRDGSLLNPERFPEDGMELNRFTVTGEFDCAYVALLKEWEFQNNIKSNDTLSAELFRAHLNRGAMLLSGRIRSLIDLVYLE